MINASGNPTVIAQGMAATVAGSYNCGHWWPPHDDPIYHIEINGIGNPTVLVGGSPVTTTISRHSCGEMSASISPTVLA